MAGGRTAFDGAGAPAELSLGRLAFLVLFAVIATAFTPAAAEDFVTACSDRSYPPYEFADEAGTAHGFNVDVARAVAETMGLDIRITPGPWSEIRRQLEAGETDMVTGMFYSKERDHLVDFSRPFILVTHSIFVRRDSRIRTIEDIRDKVILVQAGDIMDDYVQETGLGREVLRADSPLSLMRELSAGKGDCALTGKLTGQYVLDKAHIENVVAVGPPIAPREYCFAVPEGQKELLDELDEGLRLIDGTGRFDEIYQKWFGVYERRALADVVVRYVLLALVPLALLLAASVVCSWSLSKKVSRQTARLEEELARRKNAQEALADSERKYRLVIENASVGIIVIQHDKVVFSNAAATKQTGYSREELSRKCYLELIAPEDRETVARTHGRQIDGKDVPLAGMLRLLTREGLTKHLRTSGVCIDWQGDPAVLVFFVDITPEVRAREQAKSLEERVHRAEKMQAIGRLAAGIAHDFNNQLAAITGYAELVRQDGGRGGDEAEKIIKTASRAADLVRQLLAFASRRQRKSEPVDLHKVISETIESLSPTVADDIDVKTRLAAAPATTMGDAAQVHNAFLNIARNACEAMPGGGELIFSTDTVMLDGDYCRSKPYDISPGRYIVTAITDTGSGMDEATLTQVFEPFFSTRGEGHGMGLASAYGTIKSHGGAVSVYSVPGRGTTFRVYLPAAQAAEKPLAREPLPRAPRPATIMIIEDEETIRDTAARTLVEIGYRVIAFADGDKALDRYGDKWRETDVVLLDMVMPGKSGPEIFRDLRTINPAVKVIISSGYSDMSDIESVLAEGAVAFLQKPYTMLDLSRRILDVVREVEP